MLSLLRNCGNLLLRLCAHDRSIDFCLPRGGMNILCVLRRIRSTPLQKTWSTLIEGVEALLHGAGCDLSNRGAESYSKFSLHLRDGGLHPARSSLADERNLRVTDEMVPVKRRDVSEYHSTHPFAVQVVHAGRLRAGQCLTLLSVEYSRGALRFDT